MVQERMTSAEYRKQFGPTEAPKRKHKYGAQSTTVDGIRFDSKKEAQHYSFLKSRERVGEITDLKLQVEFPLEVNGILICKYKSDFQFRENGELKTIDVKGMRTPVYEMKKKLMVALYGIEIIEV